jgi:hypothetical protein
MQKEMQKDLGGWRLTMEKLLGNPKGVKHTMRYIQETGRLDLEE